MVLDGFMSPMIDMVNDFYAVGIEQLSWVKEIQGTKCIVTRLKEDSKYKRIHGSTASSTLALDKDVTEFEYTVIINMNDVMKIFRSWTII
jgi:hypothetical protein